MGNSTNRHNRRARQMAARQRKRRARAAVARVQQSLRRIWMATGHPLPQPRPNPHAVRDALRQMFTGPAGGAMGPNGWNYYASYAPELRPRIDTIGHVLRVPDEARQWEGPVLVTVRVYGPAYWNEVQQGTKRGPGGRRWRRWWKYGINRQRAFVANMAAFITTLVTAGGWGQFYAFPAIAGHGYIEIDFWTVGAGGLCPSLETVLNQLQTAEKRLHDVWVAGAFNNRKLGWVEYGVRHLWEAAELGLYPSPY